MRLVVGLAAGFVAGRLAWLLLRPTFQQTVFLRENWRGRWLPTGAGLVVPVALLLVEGGRAVSGHGLRGGRAVVVIAATGFGLLGLLDDLASGGDRDARGFRGHVGALARGRLTTGGLKLVGGLAVAAVACGPAAGGRAGTLVADAALVALAANLGNLLDRRPGRALKASGLAFVALAALSAHRAALAGAAVAVGAGLALLVDDLHEHLMLGDTGANALGAVLGLGVVLACGPTARLATLLALLALNLLSEVVSFTRIVEAVPPLRAADQWGRRPPPSPGPGGGARYDAGP
jgi:UDP-N-acetylmuramyl pentapeptide phosphotransferase/UDP-N-acetylglucosamine-1-phosphate transferase